jgi:hypothetical protein
MSQFIDKLKQASGGGTPMGFRALTAAKTAKPRMLLVAAVARADAARLADIAAGADAGLLAIERLITGAEALKQAAKAVPGIPWGGWLKEAAGEVVGKMGADFIVFPAASPLFEEKMGKILEVEPTLEPGLLKSADGLLVDAVLIAAENEPLTWRDLMLIQRGANILSKPLLVAVPPEVTAVELGALSEAGVRGVVVRVAVGGRIAGIAKILAKLPPPSARRKAGPLLPRISGETSVAAEEEEEEE